MPDKSYITKITLPSGNTYYVKDEEARDLIESLMSATKWLGVTTSAITDGSDLNPITIDGKSVTAVAGDIVSKGSAEFIFNGTTWQAFGDLSALGALAYKSKASGTFTPAGTVSKPTFSGEELTSTGSVTATGNVTISKGNGAANYTPEGDVSKPTFSGDEMTSTGKVTPAGSVTISKGNGTANYTPEGTVSKPDVTVTPTTDNVYSITDVGTLPTATMPTMSTTVANETLTIGWSDGSFSQGTLPTKGAAQSVLTGVSAALAAAPAFTGTGAELKAAFEGTEANVSVKGTPTGEVSKPSFTGTGADLEASFAGTAASVSVKGTPAGTVSQPTFEGTAGTVEVE